MHIGQSSLSAMGANRSMSSVSFVQLQVNCQAVLQVPMIPCLIDK